MNLSGFFLSLSASDAAFVRVAMMKESDNEEDDKVYLFFTERAQEAEGPAGKVLYTRVARVCKVCVCVFVRTYFHFCDCVLAYLPACVEVDVLDPDVSAVHRNQRTKNTDYIKKCM